MPIRFEEKKDDIIPSIQLRIGNRDRIWGFTFLLDRKDVLYTRVEVNYASWVAHYCLHKVEKECDLWNQEVELALLNLWRWKKALWEYKHRTVLWTPEMTQPLYVGSVMEQSRMSAELKERILSRIYHSVIHWKEDRS
jgi:hypothetical protein